MRNSFVLKDINFLEFKRLLAKNSAKYGYSVNEEKGMISFCWDLSPTATKYCVEIYELDDRSFFFIIRMDNFIQIVAFLWLVFLVIFRRELIIFLIVSILSSAGFVLYSYFYVFQWIIKLFSELDDKNLLREVKEEKKERRGLFCPACGEALTIYDEYCPSCGLFLGKSKKKQPATRTGYWERRINYVFKRNNSSEN